MDRAERGAAGVREPGRVWSSPTPQPYARIVEADCAYMPHLKDGEVDLVITSPPYGDARTYADGTGNIPCEDYADWFDIRMAEIRRVLRPGGSFVLNINDKSVKTPNPWGGKLKTRATYVHEVFMNAINVHGFVYANPYMWYKPNGMCGKRKGRTKDSIEYCFHFAVPGEDWHFDLDAVKVPSKNAEEAEYRKELGKRVPTSGKHSTPSGYTTTGRTATRHPDLVDPGNALVIGLGRNSHGKECKAVFPPELPEFFIKSMSKPGDLVLDPFSGSGTTGQVAVGLGRRFEGAEVTGFGWEESVKFISQACEKGDDDE